MKKHFYLEYYPLFLLWKHICYARSFFIYMTIKLNIYICILKLEFQKFLKFNAKLSIVHIGGTNVRCSRYLYDWTLLHSHMFSPSGFNLFALATPALNLNLLNPLKPLVFIFLKKIFSMILITINKIFILYMNKQWQKCFLSHTITNWVGKDTTYFSLSFQMTSSCCLDSGIGKWERS